jgi:sterol desaturase/sphingolipid hydroxylase (fatty acid hydroxylase superfamily)
VGITLGQVVLVVTTVVIMSVALAVRSGLVFGMVVLAAVFIPLERMFALHPQKVFRKGWATDVVHFAVNNLLTGIGVFVAVVAVGTVLRALVPVGLRAAVARQPGVVQFLEAFVLSDVCQYFAHRATHRVPLLWRFHRVHHSIQEMDWLASARLHPIGIFLVFGSLQALFIHANVRLTFGPLRWLIATPEFHHWHHANDREYFNTNFAGEFPWIDALFGTLYLDRGRFPGRYGIEDVVPSGYLRQLAWPFRAGQLASQAASQPAPQSAP